MWTTTTPLKPGWYWWRFDATELPVIRKLIWRMNGGMWEEFGDKWVMLGFGQWWNKPIQPPE